MSALHLSDLLRRDVSSDPVITGVTADSRKVSPGALFVAPVCYTHLTLPTIYSV